MRKEGLEYAMMLAVVCLAIVGAVVVMTSLASADDSQVELPEPEYISADTMVLSRAKAPERANSGLATYESFEQALERTKAAVPDELVELARDVLARWTLEAEGWQSVERVLPERFLYFEGDGRVNHFSTEYGGGEYWR